MKAVAGQSTRGVDYWRSGGDGDCPGPRTNLYALDAKTGRHLSRTSARSGRVNLKHRDLPVAGVPLDRQPDRRRRRRHRGGQPAAPATAVKRRSGARGRPRLRHAYRQAAVDVPRRAAARRVRRRHVGRATRTSTPATWARGALHDRGRELGYVYVPLTAPTDATVRRPPARRQPVLEQPRRASTPRPASASGTSRWSTTICGTTTTSAAPIARRHHRQRQADQGGDAGRARPAFLYVFDRVTGKPVWPIEERPVPQSTVPGEVVADAAVPDQAAAVRPAGLDRGRPDRLHAGAARARPRRSSKRLHASARCSRRRRFPATSRRQARARHDAGGWGGGELAHARRSIPRPASTTRRRTPMPYISDLEAPGDPKATDVP